MVVDMGLDPQVWENPLDFNPHRFLSVGGDNTEVFDITGVREIKMMPFGAGRRVCPGYGLAMLHLEYIVANLIWHFEWKAVDGNNVDLSEKLEFTVMMKNPLCARIRPREHEGNSKYLTVQLFIRWSFGGALCMKRFINHLKHMEDIPLT
ncbi:hypothetical protein KY289_028334 [Solanum tuberosum]|nr:hypothetical protein KY289_028334 [Solanum tuberosum]